MQDILRSKFVFLSRNILIFFIAFSVQFCFSQCIIPVVPSATVTSQPSCIVGTGTVNITGLTINDWTITLTPGGTTINGNTNSISVPNLAPGTYTFTYSDTNTCIGSCSATISPVPANPSIPIIDSIQQPTCANQTGTIFFSGLPSSGAWAIAASPGSLILNGTGTIGVFTGLLPANSYSFSVISLLTGCQSASTAVTSMNALPPGPSTPFLGLTTQPTCLVNTGSVPLSGLPAVGSWAITATPASGAPIVLNGSGTNVIFTGLPLGNFTFTVALTPGGCSSTPTNQAFINPVTTPAAPIIGLVVQPTCALSTGSVSLSGLPAGNWTINGSPGSMTLSSTGSTALINGLTAGITYTFTVTNYQICTSLPSANVVLVTVPNAPPAPVANVIQPTCAVNSNSLTVLFPTGINYSYSINGIVYQDPAVFSNLPSGNYTITVIDSSNLCTSISSTSYTINPIPVTPVISFNFVDDISCNGFNDGSASVSVISGGTAPFSYAWYTTGVPPVNLGSNDTITGLPVGSFNVIVSDAANCLVVQSFSITEPTPLIFNGTSTPIDCFTGVLGTISTQASGGTVPYSYNWSSSAQNTDSIGNLTIGNYSVIVSDSNNCSDTLNFTIGIVDSLNIIALPIDTIINPGFNVDITVTGGVDYTWTPNTLGLSCDDCPNPTAMPDSSIMYYVTATDSNGCVGYDSVFVEIKLICGDIFVPTIFSPNGTGPEANNKLWVFGKASCIQRFSFQIFDRWGELVFESADISIGWDGNFKERPLPNGNFVYKLSILLYDNTIYNSSGSLTLVR